MAAPLLEIDIDRPNPRLLTKAIDVLSSDGIVAYPTDSYFALGCSLESKRAIQRLYAIKGGDAHKPLALICADLSHLTDFAKVSHFAYRTMKSLTPGAFTFILPATKAVPGLLQSKQKEIGIRIPDATLPRRLVELLGRPLVSTTATDTDGEILADAREIKERLGTRIELILDSGTRMLEPSTIVSLIDDEISIVRQGKGVIEGL